MQTEAKQTPSVRLKGVGDSLWITLDPSQPMDLLQKELRLIFERLKHLAVNAKVIMDTGGDGRDANLVEDLGRFLKETFQVGAVSHPPEKRSPKKEQVRLRDLGHSWHNHRSDVLMIAGRVRSGQKVAAARHLVILGDVNPGAEVVAGGDIMVMGSLCGTAAAGQPENDEAIVLALDFRPTQVQISGYVAAGSTHPSAKSVEFAHVENHAIVVDEYLKADPFGRLPWPVVR